MTPWKLWMKTHLRKFEIRMRALWETDYLPHWSMECAPSSKPPKQRRSSTNCRTTTWTSSLWGSVDGLGLDVRLHAMAQLSFLRESQRTLQWCSPYCKEKTAKSLMEREPNAIDWSEQSLPQDTAIWPTWSVLPLPTKQRKIDSAIDPKLREC